MKGFAKQKVPGSKLLSIKIEYTDKINSIQILGDFFIHPESSLQDIESAIIGIPTNENEVAIAARVKKVVDSKRIDMIGITPESIANTIKMAIQ